MLPNQEPQHNNLYLLTDFMSYVIFVVNVYYGVMLAIRVIRVSAVCHNF